MNELIDELIEIEKSEISCYYHYLQIIKKLYDKKRRIEYDMANVKGVRYEKQKGNSNRLAIEHRRLKLSELLSEIERKIEEKQKSITKIERKLKKINRTNEKKTIIKNEEEIKINPSEILVNVLCKKMTYKDACREYDFKSNSSLGYYIDRTIKNYLEGEQWQETIIM